MPNEKANPKAFPQKVAEAGQPLPTASGEVEADLASLVSEYFNDLPAGTYDVSELYQSFATWVNEGSPEEEHRHIDMVKFQNILMERGANIYYWKNANREIAVFS